MRTTLGDYPDLLARIGVLVVSWRSLASVAVLVALIVAAQLWAPTPGLRQHAWLYWIGQLEPPLVEEPLFRGLILLVMLRRCPPWLAVVWSGALFGAVHLPFFGLGAAGTGLVGVGWAFLRLTGSVWPTALLHYAGNTGFMNPLLFVVVLLPWVIESICRRAAGHWRRRS